MPGGGNSGYPPPGRRGSCGKEDNVQCIVYARVSTRQQAWGHGICRQIESCQQAAKRVNAYVRAVYVDVCSGAGPMPQRALAIAEAQEHGCPIYVESVDRWTRNAEDDTVADDSLSLVFCAEWHNDLAARVSTLVHKFMDSERDGAA